MIRKQVHATISILELQHDAQDEIIAITRRRVRDKASENIPDNSSLIRFSWETYYTDFENNVVSSSDRCVNLYNIILVMEIYQ